MRCGGVCSDHLRGYPSAQRAAGEASALRFGGLAALRGAAVQRLGSRPGGGNVKARPSAPALATAAIENVQP